MTKLNGVFPRSQDLKEIIEWHDWTLYDVSGPSQPIWEELDKVRPAQEYEVGHNYLFVPIPKNGETLRQVYTPTKGLGPSLTIENPDDPRWLALEVLPKMNGMIALFSRLFMHEDCAFVSSPQTAYLPNPDFVAMNYNQLIDTFQRHFRIVSPEEYELSTPIPMPRLD
ncbi:hypothetical protein JW711_01910 [Candidatus Woesearchaeota archaeon]|nr:hypothetical protein [Candidatus Woesearchaeota archaeon]